ncbi:MAG: NapC/NirT family cytochrome c [Planctomycetes bacterium]|nr:NapC/NirT family cytochrome c [Planctomycetota bacterium]
MKRRRLSVFPAEALHRLGLLIAFVLIVASREFNSTHPFLTAGLVFIFSLGYLFASVITRRAGLLYGAMLFKAVSFFLICYGLGAPVKTFPLFSVALVVFLLIVGQRLNRLPDPLKSFPLTVFRVMNMTVVVFSFWALAQVSNLMSQEGLIRHVAAFTFLGYAGVYLAHRMMGHRSMYTYIFSLFLMLGGMFLAGGLWSIDFCWLPAMASAGVILLVGTGLHREKGYNWSRHFYFCSAPIMLVSLIFSVWQWPFLILNLSLASLLLWIAYERLAKAVEGTMGAVMAERVVAKCFFFSAVGLTVPVVPMVFVQPGNLYVALAGIMCGLTFSLIAWQRRGQADKGGSYVLAAVMFASAGVLGLGRQLPGISGSIWALAVSQVILACLGLLCVFFEKAGDLITRRRIAVAAIFPVFFAWFFLVLHDQFEMALVAALIATAVVVYLGVRLKERSYYYAIGPSITGIFIPAMLLLKDSKIAWVACAAAAISAGVLFVWADARGKRIMRGAANLGWLILSIAAILIAWPGGAFRLLCCVTAVGVTAVLIAWRPNRGERDVLELFLQGFALLATTAALVMAALVSVIGLSVVVVGACLLILAVAYCVVWAAQRGSSVAHLANWLFALGALLVIFGVYPSVEARLGAGAVVVLILFLVAVIGRNRSSSMANSAVMVGHVTSIALASVALIQAWPLGASRLYMAAAPLVLFYAFMPRLRTNKGLRLGTALWISFAVLFGITAQINTPYEQQIHLMVLLSLVWLVLGYILDRTKAKVWSMPFYITAAVVASFCCIVRILGPVTDTSWQVFLISGVAFVCLFLILREDMFAYLLSVALALMAYDWLRGTSSIFTVDIFFCLAIAGAVLAMTFLLPHMVKWLTRLGSVPMFSLFTGFGAGLFFLVVAAIGGVVLGVYGIKITGHPKFCVSCHNMEEYYTSWGHSSHKDVACIECHAKPGMAGTVAAKAQGMVQLVQYIAGSYGTKPHGDISSASCQQADCHEEIANDSKPLMLYDRIKFRHDKHLSEHPNGKSLNCVSCHGQTVQGQHISVSKTTCLTCHFYGRGEKQVAAGECETCHVIPEEPVTFVDEPFSHKDFITDKKDATCVHCHSQVTQGSGTVSRARCMACHLEEYGTVEDQEEFHLIHVSEGHFDCLNCHEEIKHGVRPMAEQLLTSSTCTTCHGAKRHSIQEAIYAGTALADLDTMPDTMYEAGVACDGCHDDAQIVKMGNITLTSRISGAKQCVDCHGDEDYTEQLTEWQETTKEMINELRPALEKLEKALQSSQASAEQLAEARKLSASARMKLEFVLKDGSHGAHNIGYVIEILDKVAEETEMGQSLIE